MQRKKVIDKKGFEFFSSKPFFYQLANYFDISSVFMLTFQVDLYFCQYLPEKESS